MAIHITPAAPSDNITKIVCPYCKTKVWGVGLLQGSHVSGLTFRCKKCGKLLSVEADEHEKTK